MHINHSRLLGRFLRYVQIDTTASESASSYPSSAGQLALGKLLADELREMGLKDVEQDSHGLVWATVPATIQPNSKQPLPVVALNACREGFAGRRCGAKTRPRRR